jgi:hypothetical protein
MVGFPTTVNVEIRGFLPAPSALNDQPLNRRACTERYRGAGREREASESRLSELRRDRIFLHPIG